MRLPRDLSGHELAARLRQFGYQEVRQTGSHIILRSHARGGSHSVAIPAHRDLRVGTLKGVVNDVAHYLAMKPDQLAEQLFND